MSGQDERELEEALQRSLKENYKEGQGQGDDDDAPMVGTVLNRRAGAGAKKEEEKKFNAFTGQGVSLGGKPGDTDMNDMDAALYAGYADDPEMAMAIKLSMLEEEANKMSVPDEPQESADPNTFATLQLRFKDGKVVKRRFFHENRVQDIVNFIKKESQQYGANVRLVSNGFPRKVLEDLTKTLADYGLKKNEALTVEM